MKYIQMLMISVLKVNIIIN